MNIKKTIEVIKEILKENFKYSDLFPNDYLTDDDINEIIENNTLNNEIDYVELSIELREYLEDSRGFLDAEVIYYSNAIEYLKENDPSLTESLEIALEYGYTLENINSEILASLLNSKNTRDEFDEAWNSVESALKQLGE